MFWSSRWTIIDGNYGGSDCRHVKISRVGSFVGQIKNRKSLGLDSISSELIKYGEICLESYCNICTIHADTRELENCQNVVTVLRKCHEWIVM